VETVDRIGQSGSKFTAILLILPVQLLRWMDGLLVEDMSSNDVVYFGFAFFRR